MKIMSEFTYEYLWVFLSIIIVCNILACVLMAVDLKKKRNREKAITNFEGLAVYGKKVGVTQVKGPVSTEATIIDSSRQAPSIEMGKDIENETGQIMVSFWATDTGGMAWV